MIRKEDTPERIRRRVYEETHQVERRQANKVWATSVPRAFAEELDEYLLLNGISKVEFLRNSFNELKKQRKNIDSNSKWGVYG